MKRSRGALPAQVARYILVRAIQEEPLGSRNHFALDKDGECRVCAIGALIRHYGISCADRIQYVGNVTRFSFGLSYQNDETAALAVGAHLPAASIFYEKLMLKYTSISTVRKHLIRFIERNLPTKINVPEDLRQSFAEQMEKQKEAAYASHA